MLTDHTFAPSYASETDDLGTVLYVPAMREAATYDRISGFFSSTVWAIAWPALRQFVQTNGGRIRILCSPRLSERDADGIVSGYHARSEEALAAQLQGELDSLLSEPRLREPARLLTALIASGVVDIRLAVLNPNAEASSRRMFHDKVGLFTDAAGNQVGFRGTFNETYLGLSSDGNVESVDVWTSWEGGKDLVRLRDAATRFERLWEGRATGVDVIKLPRVTLEYIKNLASQIDSEELMLQMEDRLGGDQLMEDPWWIGDRRLRPHQQRAVRAWLENDRRGLLAHATGSGKTITGLFCIREGIQKGLHPVVIVPSELLLEQWAGWIRETLSCRTMLCGGGHSRWRSGLLAAALEDDLNPRVIVAVAASASSDEFRAQVRPFGERVLLVSDEVHRLGSPQHRRILDSISATGRLGLSATPERAGDPEGTAALFSYFGGVIDTYGIRDALKDDVLSAYEYFPEFVSLNDEEQERFEELTRRINRQAAIALAPSSSESAKDRLKRLLIDRARIIKTAAAKPSKCTEVVRRMYRPGQRWLIYCDNRDQLDEVRRQLGRTGIESWEYFRGMPGNPGNTLRVFESNGGIVVSIRCLDEGVDIPASDHALILASSRNPREYIQRRGRVLRREAFKTLATVVDILTTPQTLGNQDAMIGTITGEIARAMEFAAWSLTRTAEARVREKWVGLGLELADLPGARLAGIEDDSNEGELS
jgi:superfamily II DNA or RNA helicase